jgi:hypothetical protein
VSGSKSRTDKYKKRGGKDTNTDDATDTEMYKDVEGGDPLPAGHDILRSLTDG